MNKNSQDFCTTHYRAEILTIFCSYLGRNDDIKNSFLDLLTFKYSEEACAARAYPSNFESNENKSDIDKSRLDFENLDFIICEI